MRDGKKGWRDTIRALMCLALSSLYLPLTTAAQQPTQVIDLWPQGLPADAQPIDAALRERLLAQQQEDPEGPIRWVDTPSISVFLPPAERANGTGVIICPGGGYHVLAWQHEGLDLARWFNSWGVTAFVLKYRVPRRNPERIHWEPLQDLQRAIRVVRHRAQDFKVDPDRLGVLGFSAGGHLTVMSGVAFDQVTYPECDAADRLSPRPNFICPIYPAYLGENYRDDVSELGSLITVTRQTPPMFLAVTWDDRWRGAQAALLLARMRDQGVPAELHVFAAGGHGYGIRPGDKPVAGWNRLLQSWMEDSGWSSPPAKLP